MKQELANVASSQIAFTLPNKRGKDVELIAFVARLETPDYGSLSDAPPGNRKICLSMFSSAPSNIISGGGASPLR